MEPGRLIFSSPAPGGGGSGQMMFLDCGGGGMFRGGGPVAGVEEGRGGVKRPFFTSADELLLDEDCFDQQLPEKKRRLTPEQVHVLERSFEEENKLEPERKAELARKLGLQPRQVAVWFQNRRARWKTKQLERDFDRLKASFDALRADHDALLHHNHHLRSQVMALTENLRAKEEEVGGGGATATANTLEVQADVGVSVGDGELPPEVAAVDTQSMKAEERLSPGSGGSAVVDAGGAQLVLDSSGESYFPGEEYGGCGGVGAADNGEDGGAGSDEGCSYSGDAGVIFGAHSGGGGGHDDVEVDGELRWWMWN